MDMHGAHENLYTDEDGVPRETELLNRQLMEDFNSAIRERQFEVWYQPKFDIRGEIPVLTGAEALVRWRHPRLGLLYPGAFISLLEENGLIETLDQLVWREAARQLRAWKDTLCFSAPVSVNVSRADILNPRLIDTLMGLRRDCALNPSDLLLEIRESACTQDSDRIIETVKRLRERGFPVELDDFGSGTSSLSLLSAMPVNAMKLDVGFIRDAFREGRGTRMLEIIIEIADHLSVPVIAEGVETREQLNTLKIMGCDMAQGYIFSRPVPAAEYEAFLTEARDLSPLLGLPQCKERDKGCRLSFGKVANALSSGYDSVYLVNLDNDNYVEFSSQGRYKELKIEQSGTDFFADTLRNISRVVCEGDRERLANAMQKDKLLQSTSGAEPFSILYRLLIGGKPLYYSLRAIRDDSGEQNHLIIGVRNVDAQIQNHRRMGEQSDFTPDFTGLAKAISRDIESIYYVDLEDDSYLEYRSDGAYGLREIESGGRDFFSTCQRDIQVNIFSGDWEKVASAMDKENLLRTLRERESFSMDYRLLRDGKPLYYRLKVMPAETGGSFRHLIIGVSNVDRQITEEQRQSAERQNLESFARIAQALAQDYFIIYYVDVETDYFIEYSAEGKFLEHGIEKRGEDFFGLSRRNMTRFVYREDLPAFQEIFTKENILREVEAHGSFSYTYRMVIENQPRYVMMKVTRFDNRHIVIGTSDVDTQVRREQAQARALQQATELASRDPITGVKSKRVFVEAEHDWDERIMNGETSPFAVAFFDLNGLKTINDTFGHAAGDAYIKSGCAHICTTFKHSPVYRVGGDEFAAILTGQDYENREELKARFRAENRARHFPDEAVTACGMADYIPGEDSRFQDVLERADGDMYEDKKRLKQ